MAQGEPYQEIIAVRSLDPVDDLRAVAVIRAMVRRARDMREADIDNRRHPLRPECDD